MKRKRIAIFICAISMENQKKILEGILREARQQKILCYIFTCHLNFQANTESQEGTYNIMRLPDLSHFDGAILLKNTIQYTRIADELEERIRNSGIPCVNIAQKIPGMGSVMVKNYEAEYEVVRYLIQSKGAKLINFVSGYPGNPDGEERLRAYCDALSDNGIKVEKERIFSGNYSIGSGVRAVQEWLSRNERLPDAYVCANDQMAIGVIEELNRAGYSVPGDTMVTGFDGDDLCQAFSPQIATVETGQHECGGIAVRQLIDAWSGKAMRTEWVEGSFRKAESCGDYEKGETAENICGTFVKESVILRQTSDFIRNMSSDFTEAETLEAFYETMKKYIRIGDMSSCYLCICEIDKVFHRENPEKRNLIDLKNINTGYTETVTIPVACHADSFMEYSAFFSGLVLPEEIENKDVADFYVVTPVNYHHCCYGYFVSADSYFSLQSELFYSWVSNVGIALENIRKWILMNGLMRRLNDMWIYDTMTKLYNRAGFYYIAEDVLSGMKEKKADAFMLFIDLDGLKRINDTLGHEAGDDYISAMGRILRDVKRVGDLAMRYGGDEFVLFGICRDEAEGRSFVQKIEERMKNYSFGKEAFPLEASIGLSFCPAEEIRDLHEFIHAADEKMYELKKKKKQKIRGR